MDQLLSIFRGVKDLSKTSVYAKAHEIAVASGPSQVDAVSASSRHARGASNSSTPDSPRSRLDTSYKLYNDVWRPQTVRISETQSLANFCSSGVQSLFPSSSSLSSSQAAPSLFNFIQRSEKGELSFRGMSRAEVNQLLWDNRTVCTAGTASLISTAASFPFDSLKSRLQVKYYPSVWSCARAVICQEGLGGFFRGVTVPLITISFVRTSSFGIYVNTKDYLHQHGKLTDKSRLTDVLLSGMAGGATSGIIISCGSAPFELVKVQRQLEYLTAVQRGLIGSSPPAPASGSSQRSSLQQQTTASGKFRPQSGFQAASNILRQHGGLRGFYIGFPLHLTRDTFGTALYFGSYDSIRSLVNRNSSKRDGSLFGVPAPVVSFLSGSTAGIASWFIVYPVDLLKTNVQQRTLSHHPLQLTGYQLFTHLLRERPPPDNATRDTFVKRFLRLYRGLGVSALRSFISHGLTWTIIESLSDKIEERTGRREQRRC